MTRISQRVWSFRLLACFDDSGMSLTIDQVVTQLQQEVVTVKAQVADQIRLASSVRAINNLATTQIPNDTSSLNDAKGLAHWPGERFSAVVEEDGGVLCSCDQGVRGDVGVVS